MVKQPPRVFSAPSRSPLPMKMDARGAPPELTKAAKADTTMIRGMHTPTPVRASWLSPGMWPM